MYSLNFGPQWSASRYMREFSRENFPDGHMLVSISRGNQYDVKKMRIVIDG